MKDKLFFFSSRRRHTRWPRDWSSDVCSSDLRMNVLAIDDIGLQRGAKWLYQVHQSKRRDILIKKEPIWHPHLTLASFYLRSEERRVGKECRSGRSTTVLRERERDSGQITADT